MKKQERGSQRGSTVMAAGMVLAAGVLAWFGGRGDQPVQTGAEAAATLPGRAAEEAQVAYRSVSHGGLPTRIVIPSAGIDAPVVEVGVVVENGEARWETAWHAAGHHIDSAMPGQPGNMVISGHVSVADRRHAPVFATLDRVREGDEVVVYAGSAGYRYVVESVVVVDPGATEVLRSDARATVTLITCTRDLRYRLVVTGRFVGDMPPADPA